jgi:hypothetical protein
MKITFVRAFVVALALIGFGSSTIVSNAATTKVASASANTIPPVCPLNDPNACGLD